MALESTFGTRRRRRERRTHNSEFGNTFIHALSRTKSSCRGGWRLLIQVQVVQDPSDVFTVKLDRFGNNVVVMTEKARQKLEDSEEEEAKKSAQQFAKQKKDAEAAGMEVVEEGFGVLEIIFGADGQKSKAAVVAKPQGKSTPLCSKGKKLSRNPSDPSKRHLVGPP